MCNNVSSDIFDLAISSHLLGKNQFEADIWTICTSPSLWQKVNCLQRTS